ncbi:hypothetical protein SAMN06272737_11488 [Blastococcus mobilis]|uniref:Uncharacterized protein n=2 Tax=Blastococcus mobilis TaxID=1938746 RepID=A0A238XKK9_9ACTN|nr:hypothetical protein SAMN06272737_11488 [Blastococcus mobilis]
MTAEVDVRLPDGERRLLQAGIGEWSGSARCSPGLALLLEFGSCDHMEAWLPGAQRALAAGDSLLPRDWRRCLVLTELAFASDVLGSGCEWSTTTGLSDAETVVLLRIVQRRLAPFVFDDRGSAAATGARRPSEAAQAVRRRVPWPARTRHSEWAGVAPDGYAVLLASDVHERNGLGLELYDPAGHLVMDAFRDDDRGELSLTVPSGEGVPLPVAEWFIRSARERLGSRGPSPAGRRSWLRAQRR